MYLWRLWYDGADWCCYVIAKSRSRAKSLFHNYWREGDFIDVRGEKYATADGHEEKILDDDCEELRELGAKYNVPEFFEWEE